LAVNSKLIVEGMEGRPMPTVKLRGSLFNHSGRIEAPLPGQRVGRHGEKLAETIRHASPEAAASGSCKLLIEASLKPGQTIVEAIIIIDKFVPALRGDGLIVARQGLRQCIGREPFLPNLRSYPANGGNS
jgi:hypothetical protein